MPILSCANLRSLDDFGPYKTIPDARQTLANALAAMKAGGGILCIPLDAPAGFFPRNLVQDGVDQPGVTILDFRNGFEHTYLPPIGSQSSEGTRGSRILERDLARDLPWQDVFSAESIVSRYTGGASSFFSNLTRAVAKTSDRFDVPSLRGLFVGQTLLVTGKADSYDEPLEDFVVKSLGLDATGPHFIATAKAKEAHPIGAFVYNKNNVNGLTIRDTSNCDNQSMSLEVDRTTYGTGDTFGIAALLQYQGNIMSGRGDEGGVGIAAQIEHDLDCFWGEVESWTPGTGELVYKPMTGAPHKLGTSRPLINMKESKWKRGGKVIVVAPNYLVLGEKREASRIIGDKDVDWDPSLEGRFIAINEPSEFYGAHEKNALQGGGTGHAVHRWWYITHIEKRPDGFWDLDVERTVGATVLDSGPTLFRFDNYTTEDGNLKKLAYIIAPGAWVSDVRRAVAGTTPGNIGQAGPDDERTIVLAPSVTAGTADDFAANDPITNPPGPDVWLATAFRAVHFDNFPRLQHGPASFLSNNLGMVQLSAGLLITSNATTMDKARTSQKDANPPFEFGVQILSCTRSAISIVGEVDEDNGAAIDLAQPFGRPHRIRWLHRGPSLSSSPYADPATGNFVFLGGDLDFQQRSSVQQQGLSATTTAARNLSAVNVSVAAGAMDLTIAFEPTKVENDDGYCVLVQCSWLTEKAVTNKTATGFKVVFGTAAPTGGGKLDWLLVRGVPPGP